MPDAIYVFRYAQQRAHFCMVIAHAPRVGYDPDKQRG